KKFIEDARPVRKALGGGMRQAGVLAAAGLIALEEMPKRLHEDHANAKLLAEGLGSIRGIQIDPVKVQTNIVIFDVSGTTLDAAEFATRLKQRGVLGSAINATEIRLVTHRDVDRPACEYALVIIREICTG